MEMETTMMYKLTVLYMLKKINFALSNAQIVDFFTETGYTNYFVVQQTLSSLVEISLISEEKIRNTTVYRLTPEGTDTLNALMQNLSSAIREDVDHYLEKNRFSLRSAASIRAISFPSGNKDEYIASLQIREGSSNLLELNVSVPTKEEADSACSRFKENSAAIYQNILKALLS